MNQEKKRLYLSSPTMNGREQEFIKEAFDTNWVAPLGKNVDEFEKELAAFVGIGHAAALSSGTAAIHLALKLLKIETGDIVFVSSLTFSASSNPIAYEKATPVFIDAEPDTWNMSPEALKEAFKKYPNPKAVILVHLYGTPAKLDEIMAICQEHQVPLIEDAAESLSATYKGRQTGTFGKLGIYSFNGNKIITTSGGGMLVSDDDTLIQKARFLSTQARDPARHYQHSEIGYNYRMSNILAGIGRGQMTCLMEHKKKKNEIYNYYKEQLSGMDAITMNPMNPDGDANNWLSCITIAADSNITPDILMDAMEIENMESRPIWKPMHIQPVFSECDFFKHPGTQTTSVAEDIFVRGVCLPSDVKNTKEDMDHIIAVIKKLF